MGIIQTSNRCYKVFFTTVIGVLTHQFSFSHFIFIPFINVKKTP